MEANMNYAMNYTRILTELVHSLSGQKLVALASSFFFLTFSHVTFASNEGKLEFALIGDMPYDAIQKKEFAHLMNDINNEELAFVIHNGDFWFDGIAWKDSSKGLPPCADETFKDRLKLAEKSKHPYILTPGDNDWTDCHRAKPVAYNPLNRLTKLRKMFFQGDDSLGQRKMRLTRQSNNPKYRKFPENVRWNFGGVQFVTLHMTGSNNNFGRTPEMDKEYHERNAANLSWTKEAFKLAKNSGSRAIMIITQANPQFENNWSGKLRKRYLLGGLGIKPNSKKRTTGFDDFLTVLEKETLSFKKPVVFVHGDTHTFRIDKPLTGSKSKRMIENFTRVETFGFKNTHWLRATIDPTNPNVFQFNQEIVKENMTNH